MKAGIFIWFFFFALIISVSNDDVVQPNPLGAVSEEQVDRIVEMINDGKAEEASDNSD